MILVTGATGLLGSNLLVELVKDNDAVIALYRNKEKIKAVNILFHKIFNSHAEVLFNKIEWVDCDILDLVTLSEQIKRAKIVYHCAAKVSFQRRDFSTMMKVNGKGTANVVNACLDNKNVKLCHVSSTAAVGKMQKEGRSFVVETNKWTQNNETSGYAISKYTAEKEVWRGIEEGLDAVIINPSVMFGPGDWNESSLTIFKTLSKGLKFYTGGANAFVDVRDVVFAMIKLTNSPLTAQRYLCTGTNCSFKSLFEKISKELKIKAPYIKANYFLIEIAWRIAAVFTLFTGKATLTKESVNSSRSIVEYDSSKLLQTLDFKFRDLEETIAYSVANKINS
jgi:dihydroflavonol-4-reductase